jgi:hypothetical protein
MSSANGHSKHSEKGLLTQDNCVVTLIDHQPQMLFGVDDITPVLRERSRSCNPRAGDDILTGRPMDRSKVAARSRGGVPDFWRLPLVEKGWP